MATETLTLAVDGSQLTGQLQVLTEGERWTQFMCAILASGSASTMESIGLRADAALEEYNKRYAQEVASAE